MPNSSQKMRCSDHREVAILAHRGTSVLAPENTLPAFEFARNHNADTLELDVRLTRDRMLLVIHDDTVDRTTNGNGKISDQSSRNLLQLDAGYRFNAKGGFPSRGTGVRLLTITEVLDRFSEMRINIDVKDETTEAVDILAKVVADAGAEDRIVVASFHRVILQYCRWKYPQLTTSACSADVKTFLWRYIRRTHLSSAMPVSLFQLPRSYYVIHFDSRWFLQAVHDAGGQVHFWTINNERDIRKLIAAGADGIVTDRADIARKVLLEHQKKAIELASGDPSSR